MKIAVTFDNGKVFQHFGHTEVFKVYTVDNVKIIDEQMLYATEGGHSALSVLLLNNKIDALICGGIGGGAISALKDAGIMVYGGVTGDCREAVEALVAGKLKYNPNVRCSHHDAHHSEGESCHGPNGCAHHGGH